MSGWCGRDSGVLRPPLGDSQSLLWVVPWCHCPASGGLSHLPRGGVSLSLAGLGETLVALWVVPQSQYPTSGGLPQLPRGGLAGSGWTWRDSCGPKPPWGDSQSLLWVVPWCHYPAYGGLPQIFRGLGRVSHWGRLDLENFWWPAASPRLGETLVMAHLGCLDQW